MTDWETESTEARESPIPMLAVRPGVRLRVDLANFEALCPGNKDVRLELTADGFLIVELPYTLDPGWRITEILGRLGAWNERAGLGVALTSSVGYLLPNGAVRGPVLSWMTNERWAGLSDEDHDRPVTRAVPDFVVEMRSWLKAGIDFRAKMAEYVSQGVRLGWLIDPITKTVEISRPGRDVEILTRPATLSGEDVLPGFTLDLKGILFD